MTKILSCWTTSELPFDKSTLAKYVYVLCPSPSCCWSWWSDGYQRRPPPLSVYHRKQRLDQLNLNLVGALIVVHCVCPDKNCGNIDRPREPRRVNCTERWSLVLAKSPSLTLEQTGRFRLDSPANKTKLVSIPDGRKVFTRFVWTWARKSSAVVFDKLMSLNIPSNLQVNWQPHSVFKREIIFFSASSEADLFNNKRLARCCL